MSDGRMLTVSFRAKTGKAPLVAKLLGELATATRAEPGCILYEVGRNEADPDRFVIVERFVSHAAFETHQATDHYKRIVPELFPGLAEDVNGQWWGRLTDD